MIWFTNVSPFLTSRGLREQKIGWLTQLVQTAFNWERSVLHVNKPELQMHSH